ncbi:MAG: response regulator transcription factor [Actinomyces sp.]|jgi:response regulator|uniref:response regulator transcription factor n=1 Tax=Actinomyces sp. TaxID=29317 RepID=UPI001CB1676E|nr:response regulator transcription factor [Actinomyces sp.]MBF0949578.1 response regulator transcription factor [Actinomyces sp.]MDU1430956.1 response regulator transcription factor [Actinomyces sp.]
MTTTALVVDDEPQILMIIKFALETAGITVETASDGGRAWDKFTKQYYDLVVLDLMIPVISGISLAQRIRAMSDVPIIMITALSEESDRIKGLESGADDYITKPFSPKELTLRAQSLLRRSKGLTSEVVTNGPLRVDMRQHKAFVFGVPVVLSSIERRFLEVLVQNLGEPVTYRELLNSVWETQDESGGKDMIKMTAYRLRGSLGPEGAALVQSVRSVGYMMPEL